MDHGGTCAAFPRRLLPFRRCANWASCGIARASKQATARAIGVIIGQELASHGVDFSFAPVLDVDYGESTVIGHRAFHSDPAVIAALARSLMLGLNEAGVTNVESTSRSWLLCVPIRTMIRSTKREFSEIWEEDMLPFRAVRRHDGRGMPAHVTYPKFDSKPAGFSEKWLKDVLRGRLGLMGNFQRRRSMEGASVVGGIVDRAHAALNAGYDVVLICKTITPRPMNCSPALLQPTPASCGLGTAFGYLALPSREAVRRCAQYCSRLRLKAAQNHS